MHERADAVAPRADCFCVTYQSPLPEFRPLGPPSVDVFPAAAEAKLEVNGEGMIVVRSESIGSKDFKVQRMKQALFDQGLDVDNS